MSDDPDEVTEQDSVIDSTSAAASGPTEPGAGASTRQRRPSAAATAASRARRIGGGQATTRTPPASAPGSTDSAVEPVTAPAEPVTSLEKPSADPADRSASKAKTKATTKAATTAESDEESAPAVVTQVPGWLRWAPAVVLLVGTLTMAVLIAAVSHSVWWAKPSADTVRDQVLAAAKTCMAATNTYKYTAIDAAEKKGIACTAGAFTKQYRTAVDTLIKKNAPKLKFTQTAQINTAGVESITDHGQQWTVLVFGQLAITNTTTGSAGRVDPFSALARMDRVHGKWLIGKVDLVSSPTS